MTKRIAILTVLLAGLAHAALMVGTNTPTAIRVGTNNVLFARVGTNLVWQFATPWTPAQLPGLALWFDASDYSTLWSDTGATIAATNGGLVARWNDKSGNGRNLTQSSAALQPTLNASVLTFAADGMDGAWSVALTQQTAAAVFTMASGSAGYSRIFSQALSGGLDYSGTGHYIPMLRSVSEANMAAWAASGLRCSSAFTYAATNMLVSVHTGAAIQLFLHGAESVQYSHTLNATFTSFAVCKSIEPTAIVYTTGTLREVVVANGTSSATDRQKLEGYLAHKWKTTAHLPVGHPYKTTAP